MAILVCISSIFLICGATHGLIYRKAARMELGNRMELVVNMHNFFILFSFSTFFIHFFFGEGEWNCISLTRETAGLVWNSLGKLSFEWCRRSRVKSERVYFQTNTLCSSAFSLRPGSVSALPLRWVIRLVSLTWFYARPRKKVKKSNERKTNENSRWTLAASVWYVPEIPHPQKNSFAHWTRSPICCFIPNLLLEQPISLYFVTKNAVVLKLSPVSLKNHFKT